METAYIPNQPTAPPAAVSLASSSLDHPRSLRGVLNRSRRHLPAQTAILGVCDDGIPVLFDLNDPHPAALLVCSDSPAANTLLLQSMLHSVLSLNRPDEVQFLVLTAEPEKWATIRRTGERTHYGLGVIETYESSAADWILHLVGLAEQRRYGQQNGPALLILIDTLEYINRMDANMQMGFQWLLKEGSASGIWPVAALNAQDAAHLGAWAPMFRTRLIGHIADAGLGRSLAGADGLPTDKLTPGQQYGVQVDREWLLFWSLEID